jgi:murein L,D-transpeptidase YcbB/YkuD
MDIKPETERGKKFMKDNEEADENTFRLVKYINVTPTIPVYLLYFTIFPNQNGAITKYNDVYGYDKIIWQYIKPIHR